jgi:2-hydroxy-6-oxonona-2,4-dienedioate hydrolase
MKRSNSVSGRPSRRDLIVLAGSGAGALLLAGGGVYARPPPEAGRRIVSDPSPLLRSTVVPVNGLSIHTLVSTPAVPADAPPVVLVHGLALSGQYMVPVAEVLALHYPIYIPDLPGFGDSDKPAHVLDVPGLADWLAAWMAAIGLERATMFGNSFGCQIIVDLAARYPERVERSVLQGPTAPPEERSWLWQFIRWRQNAPHNPPEMTDVSDIDYAKCGLVRALMTFEFSLRHRIEDKLPGIAAPMLVVRGAWDPICRQGWAERVAAELPNGRLVIIPEVAHTLVFTSPRELAEVSIPFIDDDATVAAQ